MQNSARPTQSSPRPAPTIACSGFTHFWMEMAALRGSCPMPCSGKRSTPAAFWSIARGLARNEATYKQHLTVCDMQRCNDLDGRGTLSEEALAEFAILFLQTCIDQVTFMQGLAQSDQLRNRILIWAEEETRADRLPQKSGAILEPILFRGELPRGDVAAFLQTSERGARRVTSALLEAKILTSESPRAPLHLAFPARLASRWMPGLFPG
nr:hypothetical protein [Bradyrhizobium brasilense]